MPFDYSVKFEAIDKISSVVNRVNSKMAQMKAKAKSASSFVQNAFNRIRPTSEFKLKIQKALQNIKKVNRKIREMAKKPIDISLSFGSLLATGVTLGLPIFKAIEFEKAFAGVKKVVSGTDEEIAKLQKNIVSMTNVIPKTASEIASMVEAGAKMGFSIDKLAEFATITAKASVAFDISATEAGEAFGKISTQLGFTLPQLEEFGDKVNHLADTTASSAKNIIDIVKRTAGVTSSLKFDTSTIVGLASFADQMSVSSEIGATAMNQILNGMRKTEFGAKMLQERGGFALIDLAEKFKTLQGVARTKALAKMFGAGEGSRMFEKIINRTEQLKKSLDLAFSKETLGSMSREFANVSDTTANKVILMRNALDRLLIKIGNELLPTVKQMVVEIAPFIDSIGEWVGENKQLILTIGKILAVSALMLAGFLAIKLAVTPILILFKAYVAITKIVTASIWLFNTALLANPIGLIIAGIVALIAMIVLLVVHWDTVSKFIIDLTNDFLEFTNIIGFLEGVFESMKTTVMNVFNVITTPIRFAINLIDKFLSKFEVFRKAKENVENIGNSITASATDKFNEAKAFFGFSDDKAKDTSIDNTQKNHTIVDVNVRAIGAVETTQKVKSTGRVKLNTGNNGV